MQPGWFPDPDDPNARRYWDGNSWSAPLPMDAGAAAATVAAAETVPPASSYKTCVVAPCNEPRSFESEFCTRHRRAERGLAKMGSAYTSPETSAIVCPHCQTKGKVKTKQVKQKKGVSGGKLTGAVLTAGISMLGTGLSRKEKVTEMKCGNCGTVWYV